MIVQRAKDAGKSWKNVIKLAYTLFSDMGIKIFSNPKSQEDFRAYTNNKTVYVEINKPSNIEGDFRRIVIPIYKMSLSHLYDVATFPDSEIERALYYDTFLFVDFHESGHPIWCPFSKDDQKQITKTLYDGIKEAEPTLPQKSVFLKVDNCKNLIWDVVDNTYFLSKSSGQNNDILAQKIGYVFKKERRKINGQRITHYPSGILPIVYLTSAKKHRTDIPLSLVGSMYVTMSYNHEDVREKAFEVFLDDLRSKSLDEYQSKEKLKQMYRGFVSELDSRKLSKVGIDRGKYLRAVEMIDDVKNPDYEKNQRYLIEAKRVIFDNLALRYGALKGFIKTISKYISLTRKTGSLDPNTTGWGDGSGVPQEGRSQDEMDSDSFSSTLDDLMDTLGEKEKNDLLGDLTGGDKTGMPGAPRRRAMSNLSIMAADEFYKRNADPIEVCSPSSELVSIDLGPRQRWKLKKKKRVTEAELATLNLNKILSFQERIKKPVLVPLGNGYYELNEYKLVKKRIKSYTELRGGIEIPINLIKINDSSGSMMSMSSVPETSYVGSKNKYDLLMRVDYGIDNALYKICKELGKDINYFVANFSDITILKGPASFVQVYESRTHPVKTNKLVPQAGNTYLSNSVFGKIEKELLPGRTVFSLITDGQIGGDTDSLYKSISRLGRKKDTAFLYFEIMSKSTFGERIRGLARTNMGVQYYNVNNFSVIRDKLSSVLIRYE